MIVKIRFSRLVLSLLIVFPMRLMRTVVRASGANIPDQS
jgi:hypothetical protein